MRDIDHKREDRNLPIEAFFLSIGFQLQTHKTSLRTTFKNSETLTLNLKMYLRNILAAASLVAMVASAALPQSDSAYVPGFEKSCVESCKSSGTANVR